MIYQLFLSAEPKRLTEKGDSGSERDFPYQKPVDHLK